MKKLVFTLLAASSLVFTNSATDAQAAFTSENNTTTTAYEAVQTLETNEVNEVVEVAAAKATAKSGTYKLKYNTNVRADAGTKYKVLKVAKKGATATATHQKKVGKQTWYKVKVSGKHGWVLSTLLTSTKKATAKKPTVVKASNSTVTSKAVSVGLSLKGTPYRFGGTTTAGFDCSGFTQYAFKQAGKSISRTTLGQFADSVTVSSPQPGDLIFFANTYRPGISHVGIYIGNGQWVHSGGKKAEVLSVNAPYWGDKFHSYKRLK
ncbi:cell wall-associated NlpC family hydrolase [Planomicrobium koreense]|uniref:Cell wall-associated NlpC family hydrolase n=1 Tax=Planococcus koreensis TaxID=112331 RepID=A0A7W8CRX7_9BACL|nr:MULTISPECIES: C40 family peptidase [Planococcus]MBB5179403.1 cell wall-associated NlpC family hydrolase [Planococcus koreensis]MDN3451570.1 NlpC/P60 family protein [Planococcus sp. APC 3906]